LLNQIAAIHGTGVAAGGGASYESIATVTVGSAVSSISFTSIPSTFKHLQVRAIQATTTTDDDIECRFNSDTGSNYSVHRLRGNGSAASADGYANVTQFEVGRSPSAASAFGPLVFDILDYADTNKYTTGRSLFGSDGNGSGWIMLSSGNWRNTAAITTIQLRPSAGGNTFVTNSHFALYGIKG
jgi:hypothetical protein